MKKIYILIFVFSMLFLTTFGDEAVPPCKPGQEPNINFCTAPSNEKIDITKLDNNFENENKTIFIFSVIIIFALISFGIISLVYLKTNKQKNDK